MDLDPRPMHLSASRGRLFAVFHAARRPRAGVLVFPPFLQERALSYRLFALLADSLAKLGIAVLRPHYYGTGDSDGDDLDFSLENACEDASVALDALRERIGPVPIAVLGARAGSFVAVTLATKAHLQALWLWQPVTDGAAYLADLRRIDSAERRANPRFPHGERAQRTCSHESLVGFPCSKQLLAELEQSRLRSNAEWPDLTLLDRPQASPLLQPRQRIDLPPALTAWEGQLDYEHIPAPAVREVAAGLATRMGGA
ncbi:MAG: alpha/beta hydrolase [Rhodanobacteraceae bacterium]